MMCMLLYYQIWIFAGGCELTITNAFGEYVAYRMQSQSDAFARANKRLQFH